VKFDFRTPRRSGDLVVSAEGVSKAYGKRVIYDGLNLTIRRGERWAVMGRNGAGKTTLLKMVAGVLAPDVHPPARRTCSFPAAGNPLTAPQCHGSLVE
jgi:ATPase subunit of ABC transporter with duplicated ATPase domains